MVVGVGVPYKDDKCHISEGNGIEDVPAAYPKEMVLKMPDIDI